VKRKQILDRIDPFIDPYKVESGKSFKLSDIDPGDTHELGSESKEEARELLRKGTEWLAELQDKLYADDRWGMLLIFQAMDAAGKDGTIKHVMSGVNPQGCQVFSFKQPSAEDLDHDFMWRYARCLPERGRIGIFNRSYYEEVLVVRVHEEILQRQKLPEDLVTKRIWDDRLEDMRNFERYLSRNGIVVLKFFLHVSHKEQKKRFMDRLDRKEKNWKFSVNDIQERQYWKSYMKVYEDAIKGTASGHAPWFVVPADNKWFTRLVVAGAIVDALERLDLDYPKVDKNQQNALKQARELLASEKKR
jgi:PPK2 family polyphosphate:nucleotide phosphotransferase